MIDVYLPVIFIFIYIWISMHHDRGDMIWSLSQISHLFCKRDVLTIDVISITDITSLLQKRPRDRCDIHHLYRDRYLSVCTCAYWDFFWYHNTSIAIDVFLPVWDDLRYTYTSPWYAYSYIYACICEMIYDTCIPPSDMYTHRYEYKCEIMYDRYIPPRNMYIHTYKYIYVRWSLIDVYLPVIHLPRACASVCARTHR